MDDFPHLDPGELRPPEDGGRGFIGPDNSKWSEKPGDPYDPTKPPPKLEGKKLSEAPKEVRDEIENDKTQTETQNTVRESINDDAKSDKSETSWKLMRTCLKLLFSGFLVWEATSLIYGDMQTEAQCKCNYERAKEQCTQSPIASYSPGCEYCDRKEPKTCCRTCKDVLNQNIFFGLINLSFLGTDDIIDLKSSGCKSETEDECCTSITSRVGTATDEVSSCLMKGVEKILKFIFWGFIVLFILFNIPFIFRLITGFIGLFDKSGDKEHSHSTWWLVLPNLIILGIVGIILYARGDNDTDLSTLGIGVFILILIYFILNIWNLFHMASGKTIDTSYYNYAMNTPLPHYMKHKSSGRGGKIMLLVCVILISAYLIIIYLNCFSQDNSPSCDPSDDNDNDITKKPNLIIDIYYDMLNKDNCFDNNSGVITQYGTCLLHPYDTVFGNEGFDNSPPDCNVINSDYSSDEGDKKYYCFVSGCNYDSNNCVTNPNPGCDTDNTEDESTSSAVKNYAEVAKGIGKGFAEFYVTDKAVRGGLKVVDKNVLKGVLTKVSEKLMLESLDFAMNWVMIAGQILDLWDPCDYQSFVSNRDLKTKIRDPVDSGNFTDKSKPNFLPLAYLGVIENSQDPNSLPFKILHNAHISWSTYVNAGISQVALKGNNINDVAAKKAGDETADNNYCTFLKNYDKETSSLHKDFEKMYYSDPDVIIQINNDEPDSLKGEANNIPKLKQIQLWKYIYRYCKNGGITTVEDSSGNTKIVLYNGDPTDGKTNLPDLWNNAIDGMPALRTYIITIDTLLALADGNLIINGPATLNGVGGKELQNILKSRNHGVPCQSAGDSSKQCILDDLVISVSNIYRDYSKCSGNQDCDVTYIEFPNKEEFPLYYPSSSLVNTICRYSTRGMKWINQRQGGYTKSDERIDGWFSGANETVDNTDLLGSNYYNEETGLCNYNPNYCHRRGCMHTYCFPKDSHNSQDANTCITPANSTETFIDCDTSDIEQGFIDVFGKTVTCEVENLFTNWNDFKCPN